MSESYFRRNEDFIYRDIAGEAILVPTGQAARKLNGMVSLNETGAFLWNALAEPRTPAALVEQMTAEYEIDTATALEDISGFLEKAEENEMVLRVQE